MSADQASCPRAAKASRTMPENSHATRTLSLRLAIPQPLMLVLALLGCRRLLLLLFVLDAREHHAVAARLVEQHARGLDSADELRRFAIAGVWAQEQVGRDLQHAAAVPTGELLHDARRRCWR